LHTPALGFKGYQKRRPKRQRVIPRRVVASDFYRLTFQWCKSSSQPRQRVH